MFTVEIDRSGADIKFAALAHDVRNAIAAETFAIEQVLVARAQANAGGLILRRVTGRYAESIKGGVTITDDGVSGKVDSDDPRAGIFERGGVTGAHDIAPRVKQVLAFMSSAGEVFATAVHHPGSRIAPHPAIHQAFADSQDAIRGRLVGAGLEVVRRW